MIGLWLFPWYRNNSYTVEGVADPLQIFTTGLTVEVIYGQWHGLLRFKRKLLS